MNYRDTPRPVTKRQWAIFVVTQIGCVWLAIEAYRDMNSGVHHVGNAALVICIPVVAIPLLYGLGLAQSALAHVRHLRRLRTAYSNPSTPLCDICQTNTPSWNTRTNEWMDTCRECRNPNYYDNDNTIG